VTTGRLPQQPFSRENLKNLPWRCTVQGRASHVSTGTFATSNWSTVRTQSQSQINQSPQKQSDRAKGKMKGESSQELSLDKERLLLILGIPI
jgi:hypothetical protein